MFTDHVVCLVGGASNHARRGSVFELRLDRVDDVFSDLLAAVGPDLDEELVSVLSILFSIMLLDFALLDYTGLFAQSHQFAVDLLGQEVVPEIDALPEQHGGVDACHDQGSDVTLHRKEDVVVCVRYSDLACFLLRGLPFTPLHKVLRIAFGIPRDPLPLATVLGHELLVLLLMLHLPGTMMLLQENVALSADPAISVMTVAAIAHSCSRNKLHLLFGAGYVLGEFAVEGQDFCFGVHEPLRDSLGRRWGIGFENVLGK